MFYKQRRSIRVASYGAIVLLQRLRRIAVLSPALRLYRWVSFEGRAFRYPSYKHYKNYLDYSASCATPISIDALGQ